MSELPPSEEIQEPTFPSQPQGDELEPPPTPGSGEPGEPPVVALRTYTAIRLGVVAVIVALGIAVGRAIGNDTHNCVQRSLSAYYYTPVRPVFVGTLLIIGFAMVSMWGKTFVEDAALNLAGLLLTVVAFVPTLDATGCTLSDGQPQTPADKDVADAKLINANAADVQSNVVTLLIILAAILGGILVWGIWWYVRAWRKSDQRPDITDVMIGYGATWLLSGIAVFVYFRLYQASWISDPNSPGADVWNTHSFFNNHVHSWSANLAVALIIAAVVFAAIDKYRHPHARERWRWFWSYTILGFVMVAATVIIKSTAGHYKGRWYGDHETFLLEATLIALLGAFWVIQTIDRRGEGAPTY